MGSGRFVGGGGASRVHAPTLVIVGEVVQLREKLAWFEGSQQV
jgi:siroheme synthase